MAYQDKISEARHHVQKAMNHIHNADQLLVAGRLATASGKHESAAAELRRAAQLTRDALVAREVEREDSEDEEKPEPDAGAAMAWHKQMIARGSSKREDPGEVEAPWKPLSAAGDPARLTDQHEAHPDPLADDPRYKGSRNDSLRMAADELEDEETFGAGPSA